MQWRHNVGLLVIHARVDTLAALITVKEKPMKKLILALLLIAGISAAHAMHCTSSCSEIFNTCTTDCY